MIDHRLNILKKMCIDLERPSPGREWRGEAERGRRAHVAVMTRPGLRPPAYLYRQAALFTHSSGHSSPLAGGFPPLKSKRRLLTGASHHRTSQFTRRSRRQDGPPDAFLRRDAAAGARPGALRLGAGLAPRRHRRVRDPRVRRAAAGEPLLLRRVVRARLLRVQRPAPAPARLRRDPRPAAARAADGAAARAAQAQQLPRRAALPHHGRHARYVLVLLLAQLASAFLSLAAARHHRRSSFSA
jgi:hypothetical protein